VNFGEGHVGKVLEFRSMRLVRRIADEVILDRTRRIAPLPTIPVAGRIAWLSIFVRLANTLANKPATTRAMSLRL
jgi:hypothetical protein